MDIGDEVIVDIEKPTAGGRMLARHDGQVLLVWGGIPGERLVARIERIAKGVVFAETAEVLTASADRRDAGPDWRCGGNVLAHVAYERQRRLKGEIIQDALARIGHVTLPAPPDVIGSPERGYRMRARLHVQGGQLGFYREGTHQLCDVASTNQLLPGTAEWINDLEAILLRDQLEGLLGVEIVENIPGRERALHLQLHAGIADASRFAHLEDAATLNGISVARADRPGAEVVFGTPVVSDVVHVRENDPATALRLRREAQAFFQGNRYLVEPLVRRVVALVEPGPVVDLYAGVGLFGLALAVAGAEHVTLVEGDPAAGPSLDGNAEPFGERVTVHHNSVESFLESPTAEATFIVDPPRTGMSKEAVGGIVRVHPTRLIYVSCDVATLARDARTLLDAGYELQELTGVDLFPNTAHVEAIAVFATASS